MFCVCVLSVCAVCSNGWCLMCCVIGFCVTVCVFVCLHYVCILCVVCVRASHSPPERVRALTPPALCAIMQWAPLSAPENAVVPLIKHVNAVRRIDTHTHAHTHAQHTLKRAHSQAHMPTRTITGTIPPDTHTPHTHLHTHLPTLTLTPRSSTDGCVCRFRTPVRRLRSARRYFRMRVS